MVVPGTLRVAMKDDFIPTSEPVTMNDGSQQYGVHVAKGTHVHISYEGFNSLKEIWGEDAWEFVYLSLRLIIYRKLPRN